MIRATIERETKTMSGFTASTLKASKRALEDLRYSIVAGEPQLTALIQSLQSTGSDARRVTVLKAIQKSTAGVKNAIVDVTPKLDVVIETTIKNEVSRGAGVPVASLEKYQRSIDDFASTVRELSKQLAQLVKLNSQGG